MLDGEDTVAESRSLLLKIMQCFVVEMSKNSVSHRNRLKTRDPG